MGVLLPGTNRLSMKTKSAPGQKDIARIKAFIAEARAAFARADAGQQAAHAEARPGRVA